MRRAELVAVLAVLGLLTAATVLDLSGHRVFVVGGASMEPAIPRGSLVLVRGSSPYALAVGDVVTFEHQGQVVTHRLASVDDAAGTRVFTTKGDANAMVDPDQVAFYGEVGLVEAQVPLAGYALGIVQAYARSTAFGLAAVFAVLALRRLRGEAVPVPTSA